MSPSDFAARKVLIVDDDRATLRLIAKITTTAGYQVATAKDGREAFERILDWCPDLLVTDWDMPQLSGLQLCRKVREEKLPFYVYVMLLTAKSRSEELVEGLEAGADDFITKPIEPPVFLARLKSGMRTVTMERRLRDIAKLDPLTGIMNRRTFHERAAAEWDRASRYAHPLSCVIIDLDFFKRINDTLGHAAGDAVLQAVATLLESHSRSSDVLARYGGEEFCVLLAETDETGAAVWAERFRQALAAAPIFVSNQALSVTGSIGVAARLPDTTCPESLVALADQALGAAKESGRNRVVRFSTIADVGLGCSAIHTPWDNVLARDVMAPTVYSPHQDNSVTNVADMFLQLRLNAAPVVDQQGLLAGILSENDILAVSASTASLHTPISDCMKTNVVQYDEETPAKTVYQFLSRVAVPRVVVVKEGRPTGVISRATLLRWLRNWSNLNDQGDRIPRPASASSRHGGILKAAAVATERLAILRNHLSKDHSDFVPCAVAEATRLEELANEILAHCRGQVLI